MAPCAKMLLLSALAGAVEAKTPLKDLMDMAPMLQMLKDLEKIANVSYDATWAPNGTRDRSTQGVDDTVEYLMEKIGNFSPDLKPRKQTYEEKMFKPNLSNSIISRTDGTAFNWTEPQDFSAWWGSSYALVQGNLASPKPGPDNATRGCFEEDYVGFPKGAIAFVMRGNCALCDRWTNAIAAGASALIMYEEPGKGWAHRDMSRCANRTIPFFGMPYENAQLFWPEEERETNVEVRLEYPGGEDSKKNVSNVILDINFGDPTSVVVVGAHLDSVLAGPGVNDDGSGSAVIMEMLRNFGREYGFGNPQITNAIRFCWWASEEHGLLGSRHYVRNLSPEEDRNIAGYINFDMMGSPNGINSVIDGAIYSGNMKRGVVTPDASRYITNALANAFVAQGQNYTLHNPASSDFESFLEHGIPAGAIRSGAFQTLTPELQEKFGGIVGMDQDPCYHKVCDTVDNLDKTRMFTFSKVAATVFEDFFMDPDLKTKLARTRPEEEPEPTTAPVPDFPTWAIFAAVGAVVLFLGLGAFFMNAGSPTNMQEPTLVDEVETGGVRNLS